MDRQVDLSECAIPNIFDKLIKVQTCWRELLVFSSVLLYIFDDFFTILVNALVIFPVLVCIQMRLNLMNWPWTFLVRLLVWITSTWIVFLVAVLQLEKIIADLFFVTTWPLFLNLFHMFLRMTIIVSYVHVIYISCNL